MSIYTRTGDRGETSLFGGGRVPKDHVRVAAYGDVDHLNCVIGTALATAPRDFETELLTEVQRDLFAIGGRLATPDEKKVERALEKAQISGAKVKQLEQALDRADRDLPELKTFVLPGGSPKGALLHLARAACRRAERSVVSLDRVQPVPDEIIPYLNRLSDLLFTLARLANRRASVAELSW
ncbi:MAG: cob(I)yrinic acid a,c-diamide adenosyltransferase [Gemmatimonadales bacterium]